MLQKYWKAIHRVSHALDKHDGRTPDCQKEEIPGGLRGGKEAARCGKGGYTDLRTEEEMGLGTNRKSL